MAYDAKVVLNFWLNLTSMRDVPESNFIVDPIDNTLDMSGWNLRGRWDVVGMKVSGPAWSATSHNVY